MHSGHEHTEGPRGSSRKRTIQVCLTHLFPNTFDFRLFLVELLPYEAGSREHQFGDVFLKESRGWSRSPGTTAKESWFFLSPVGMLHLALGYASYSSWGATHWDYNVNDTPELSIHQPWLFMDTRDGGGNH